MTTITMHPVSGPAEPALPPGHFVVHAEDGRRIVSKPMLRVREEMALSEHIGADARLNPIWVLWATLACCVTHIGDEPVRMPVSRLQVEALIDRIGDEAMRALLAAYRTRNDNRVARAAEMAKN